MTYFLSAQECDVFAPWLSARERAFLALELIWIFELDGSEGVPDDLGVGDVVHVDGEGTVLYFRSITKHLDQMGTCM